MYGDVSLIGDHMLVDVVFDQIRSAQVWVEVDDDATEEQIEATARKHLEESD
jgi:hypothetical protein